MHTHTLAGGTDGVGKKGSLPLFTVVFLQVLWFSAAKPKLRLLYDQIR